ncbi:MULTISPECIES: restriction endonuclease subunit S [unclassified Sphingomonas]|uniref:restriction endonuclease subunit S n=1 Tax=unclassified Sphingomonas TaxID=196159 RepID=UPI0006F7FAD6|nr:MULTISPECIES: restriction endonuclease subunit S [unclassified Sphingomonas]KQM27946.1 hypothetical protein ASE58_06355 [Sphingomonas sp. Leaf9]KQM44286.1 hypothetical protein ASE57_06350 [Sphingomonas sp. Leaf11]KQM81088.1 hypothetical protein ASE67_17395 [Sphingomonas sp. Leaf23]
MTLPTGWIETTVGDVSATKLGKMLDANKNKGEPVAYLRNVNVRWGAFDLSDLLEMRVTAEERDELAVRDGDLFVCEGGEPGRCAVWRGGERDLVFQKAIHRVRPLDAVNAEYIAALFTHLAARDGLSHLFTGTTIKHLPQVALQRVPFPLPPAAEQRRIVAKVDGLAVRLARARDDLDRIPMLAQSLRQNALSLAQFGSLSGSWREAQLATSSAADALDAVRDLRTKRPKPVRRVVSISLNFALPKTWAQVSPDEIAADAPHSIGIGPFGSDLVKADYRESGTRLVFVRDVRAQQFGELGAKYVNGEKAEKLKAHMVESGDLLVTKMGDPPGDVALFTGDARAIITADCIKLRAHSQLAEPDYLLFCLRFPCVQEQIRAATKGVAQQKISLDSFRRMVLPIPPLAEQRQIATVLRATFARADRLEAEAARARALLDRLEAAILAKAFRGELVPQDPKDEPASVLLDRIRAERAAAPKAKRGRARKAVG